MKTQFLLALAVWFFASNAKGQTIVNNTNCDIDVEISCFDPNQGCISVSGITFYTVPAFSPLTFPTCNLGQVIAHFKFSNGCHANDPFVAAPGNCLGLPDSDRMFANPQCGCNTNGVGYINYMGGDNWNINP